MNLRSFEVSTKIYSDFNFLMKQPFIDNEEDILKHR